MLSMYRRHLSECPHATKGRRHKRCRCPIWVSGSFAGRSVRKSLDTDSWEEAERQLEEWKQRPDSATTKKPKTLEEAVEAHLDDCRLGRLIAPITIRKKSDLLRKLIAFLNDRDKRDLREITFEDLVQFRMSWQVAPSTANGWQQVLKEFFAFSTAACWLKEDPAAALRRLKSRHTATLPFTREEVAQLLATCDRYPGENGKLGQANSIRFKTLLLVLRYTGLRIGDAVRLDDSKIHPGRIFLYQQQKTGVPVFVPIPAFLNEALATVPRKSAHYFFWNGTCTPKSATIRWQWSFRRLLQMAGFTHIPEEGVPSRQWKPRLVDGKRIWPRLHMFRDTFAVELLQNGVPIEDVQILLGHTSIKTTERHYAPWVRSRQERLEEHVRLAYAGMENEVQAAFAAGRKP